MKDRLLTRLSGPQIGAIDTRDALVVQPIGAIEQHGPHLPVRTDALVGERIAARAADLLEPEANVWLLPPLSYGKSNEHLGMPGTISMDATTLIGVCRDLGRSLAASGFTRLCFVNGHGGNPSLLDLVARDIRVETGLMVFPVTTGRLGVPPGVELPDAEFSIHGGYVESSVMLHLAPEDVRMEHAELGGSHLPELFPAGGELSLEGALPTAWTTRDLSTNGVIGDPRQADAVVGKQIVDHWAARLASAYRSMSAFAFRTS